MSAPIDAALAYAWRRWPVFPVDWRPGRRKAPLTRHGFKDATTDEAAICGWWRRWPDALIGCPTGRFFVVLDVDRRGGADGLDTLSDFGLLLPDTPISHTPSGGLHLYFAPLPMRSTTGAAGRGIGPCLDWRAQGSSIILPSPGSGYSWDPHVNFRTVPLANVPVELMPREPERPPAREPVRPAIGLSAYGEGALDAAARRIMGAPPGEQEATLNAESFSIGTLAGAGGVPADFARRVLIWAGRQMRDGDPGRPWRPAEIEQKIDRSFDQGMRHPREMRRAS